MKPVSPLEKVENISQLADLLFQNRITFLDYLYKNNNSQYIEFEIPKKNGSARNICAPIPGSPLKQMQKKLNSILQEHIMLKEMPLLDHAFIKGKSIYTGAKTHVKKICV